MTLKPYRRYIWFFICLVIASVATLPVANSGFATEHPTGCLKIDNSVVVHASLGFDDTAGMSDDCNDMETCHTDQCSDHSCNSLSYGLPVSHESLASPEVFVSPSAFAFVISPEPPGSFHRPPIA